MTVSQCDEQTKDVEIRGRGLHKKNLLTTFLLWQAMKVLEFPH